MTEKQSEIEKQHKKQATITGLICAGILSILMAGFISLVLLVPNTRLPLLITCVALLAICCIGFGAYVVGWFVGYSHDKVIVEHRVETIHINHWIATNSLELSLNQLPEDLFKANLYTVLGAHKIDKDSELGFILCDYAIKQLHNLTNINK